MIRDAYRHGSGEDVVKYRALSGIQVEFEDVRTYPLVSILVLGVPVLTLNSSSESEGLRTVERKACVIINTAPTKQLNARVLLGLDHLQDLEDVNVRIHESLFLCWLSRRPGIDSKL